MKSEIMADLVHHIGLTTYDAQDFISKHFHIIQTSHMMAKFDPTPPDAQKYIDSNNMRVFADMLVPRRDVRDEKHSIITVSSLLMLKQFCKGEVSHEYE